MTREQFDDLVDAIPPEWYELSGPVIMTMSMEERMRMINVVTWGAHFHMSASSAALQDVVGFIRVLSTQGVFTLTKTSYQPSSIYISYDNGQDVNLLYSKKGGLHRLCRRIGIGFDWFNIPTDDEI